MKLVSGFRLCRHAFENYIPKGMLYSLIFASNNGWKTFHTASRLILLSRKMAPASDSRTSPNGLGGSSSPGSSSDTHSSSSSLSRGVMIVVAGEQSYGSNQKQLDVCD